MKIQKKQEIEFFGTKTGNANSIALGYATETKNFGEVAVGIMNKSTAAKDPNSSKGVCVDPDATLFSVGCGGSGERKNALEVKGDGSVIVSGENGDINVADKIKQAFDTDASIKLVKSAENSLQYTLMVNDEPRGSIDIPKDQFLKNVTYDSEGKQLVFTFVTLDEDEHVEKVPVGDLKDIYTAGNGINIDNNVISADFSSVMTAISDEKTQRETTDNEIKSTLDTKADKTSLPTKLSDLENDKVDITVNKSKTFHSLKVDYKDNNVVRSRLRYKPAASNVSIAEFGLDSFNTAGNGLSQIKMRPENNKDDGQYIIQVQDVIGDKINHASSISTTGFDNQNYENGTAALLESDQLVFYVNSNGFQEQLTVNKDGITKKDGKTTEVFAADGTLFDLTTKADTSAIPTKVSQLTNDSNFITSYTETDPVWTREKTDYYTKTEIDNKGYLTQHQPLDNYVTKSTADANYLSLANGGEIKNQVIISKANATSDDYKLNLINEGLYIGQENGLKSILTITNNNFSYRDFVFYIDENQFTFANCFAVIRNNKDGDDKNTIQLGKVLITESSLSRLNLALDNITAASTAEEVVTKFNALLTDLKNKGLMEADTTAE